MLDDNEEDNQPEDNLANVPVLSMAVLRDKALELFDGVVNKIHDNKYQKAELLLEHRRLFLSIEETELIVRENCALDTGSLFGIGGDTMEEAVNNMRKLMSALIDRIMSNVIQFGAKEGLIDVGFDDARNDFCFSVSDEGKKFVDEFKKEFGGEDAE
jgi:hypothetical protein